MEVASVISNILNSLVEALTALPRLNDKFHVAETDFMSYSQIIAEDNNCQQMQLQLNQGKIYSKLNGIILFNVCDIIRGEGQCREN